MINDNLNQFPNSVTAVYHPYYPSYPTYANYAGPYYPWRYCPCCGRSMNAIPQWYTTPIYGGIDNPIDNNKVYCTSGTSAGCSTLTPE